jgi:hypothetical protein
VTRILTFPAGRRAKFGVFTVVFLLSALIGGTFAGKFEDAQKNETVSFLPGDAESVKALDKIKTFSGDELSGAVIVYRRDSGLTAADKRAIAADRASLTETTVGPASEALAAAGAASDWTRTAIAAASAARLSEDPPVRASITFLLPSRLPQRHLLSLSIA